MKHKLFKLLSVILIISFSITSLVQAQDASTKITDVDNVAPNASLSASVIHPKKLDLVLMSDYTGSKKTALESNINDSIVKGLFDKNVDVRLYTEDLTNSSHTGDNYYQQEYSGAPTPDPSTGPNTGNTNISAVDLNNTGKRSLRSGYGLFTWNSNNTLTFKWDTGASVSAMYEMGEAPIASTGNQGIVNLTDAPTNIAEIGATKHSLFVLTQDNKLYYSGNPSTMANNWWAIYMGSYPAAYTGMRLAFSGVKDIKTNINGIAILKTDGTVYYAGNNGLQTSYGDYSPIYTNAMSLPSVANAEMSYTYVTNNYTVTSGFQLIPGMTGITRIQLGNESIIGLNDNTGNCYGIGYNQGQFGWGDGYFRQCTVDAWNKQYTVPTELTTRQIPLLDARKIKQLYMYGGYTKVLQKDNTIWMLTGGGFTTLATDQGIYTSVFFQLYSSDPGSYTQVGTLKDDELFSIDTSATYSVSTVKTDNYVFSPSLGYNINCFLTKYTYSIAVTGSTLVKKNGTAIIKSINANNIINTTGGIFGGIHPVSSLNTDNVINQIYRTDSDKILLYVSDNISTDFISKELGFYYPMTGLNNSFMSFIGNNNFGIYIVTPSSILDFIESYYTKQQDSLRQLSTVTQDGHLYDQGNYTQAINDIVAKYSNKESLTKYVIANEDIVEYNTQFLDKENDSQRAKRWLYNHNPDIFLNNTGAISTNNQYVDNPITKFDKVGDYKITYQVQDDPTSDAKFSDYNYWSKQTEQLDIIAHRRPIAKFTAIAPKKTVTTTDLVTNFNGKSDIPIVYSADCSIVADGYAGSKTLNSTKLDPYATTCPIDTFTATIIVPTSASNALFKYVIMDASDSTWHPTMTIDNIPVYYTSSFNSPVEVSLSPGTHTLKVTSTFNGWYYRSSPPYYYAKYGSFKINNLELTYDTTTYSNGGYTNSQATVSYNNTSYDLDHTDMSNVPNTLNALPDKGIQAEEWKWIDTTPGVVGTWQSGKLTTVYKDHYYQVSLRVQDLEGAWSYPYIITLGDSVPAVNNAPIANFQLSTNLMLPGAANDINEAAPYNDYDIDYDPIVQKHWLLLSLDNIWNITNTVDYGSLKPNLANLPEGNYGLEKLVRDDPTARGSSLISLWSLPYIAYFTVQDYTVAGQVNHTELWNQNRINYNMAKSNTPDSPRGYDIFFPGEEFDLVAVTNVQALSVKVYIKEYPSFSTDLTDNGGNNWSGSIWDESMLKWKTQPLIFVFIATYPNLITKTVEVPVQIVDDLYWRQHRSF